MNTNTTETDDTVVTPIKTVNEDASVAERLTENAHDNILPARYLRRNRGGELTEDPEEMFERVANNVAAAEETVHDQEKWSNKFAHQMKTLRFMPNSPTLMNAGTDMNQLSACFVLEPEDDMEDIFKTAKDAALIFQSGGGVGYAFSHLRPKGAYINSTGGEASGPVSFMRVFDETCNQVKQGGKRRGAQMAIMRIDHPDVGRFAVAKRREGEFANFNISVGYTDEFIEALKTGDTYTLYDPTTDYEEPFTVAGPTEKFYNYEYKNSPQNAFSDKSGDLVDENLWRDYADSIVTVEGKTLEEKWGGEINLTEGEPMELPARFLWDVMIDGAYRNGEPGFFHLDETNREHSFDVEEYPEHRINATNPCAEQPLSEYEACNLGHVNLSLMMDDDAPTAEEFKQEHFTNPEFVSNSEAMAEYFSIAMDFDQLDDTIEVGVRFLDNVVTQSDFPIQEIEERVSGQRKIGLGIMGFAQLLYQMGIPYGSDESYEIAKYVMRYVDRRGTDVSNELAEEKGVFEYWWESKYANPTEYPEWFEDHTGFPAEDYADGFPIRNHNVTTIAPTGTTSMIANTSGGCEPVYNVANYKNVGNDIQGDDMLVEFDDYFIETLRANNIDVNAIKNEAKSLMEANNFDGVEDLSIPQELKEIFVTTQDLTSRQHGLMQRAFQEYCDSGISKTINLPNDATRDDVSGAYRLAFNDHARGANIKGLTVYRDGSREEQVLTTRKDNKIEDEEYCENPECDYDEPLENTDDCAVCPVCYDSPCS